MDHEIEIITVLTIFQHHEIGKLELAHGKLVSVHRHDFLMLLTNQLTYHSKNQILSQKERSQTSHLLLYNII